MTGGDRTIHRKARNYRWEGVDELPYKEDDRALFKSITRQVLFSDPSSTGSCAISRWRRAASPRWSGTSTCTRC